MKKIRIQKLKLLVSVASILALLQLVLPGSAAYAVLSSRSLNLSSATPSATNVTYDFDFTIAATTSVHHVDMTFSINADGTGGIPTGFNAGTTGTTTLTGTSPSFAWSSPTATLTFGTPTAQTVGTKEIKLTGATNPSSTGVFYVKMTSYSSTGSGSPVETGVFSSATIGNVTVSATQMESFSISVGPLSGTACSRSATTGSTSSATAVNFGTYTARSFVDSGQNISIATNASRGYTLNMVEDHAMQNEADASKTIPDFGGSSDASAGATWTTATSQFGFGICASSSTAGMANETAFGTSGSYRYLKIDTSKKIASATGPASTHVINVNFRSNVDNTQAAGTYTNTVTYVATPIF